MNEYLIRPETTEDRRETEELVREAFWNVYHPGCSEHCVLHRFRARPEFVPELDLVGELNGRIVSQIMYVRSQLASDGGGTIELLEFGPVSVSPELQKKGLGSELIRFSLKKAADMGFKAVAITGNPDFYSRFGFVSGSSRGVRYADAEPGDPAPYFMVKELKEGFFDGVSGSYRDPDGYFVPEDELERFDASFPPKEKKKLPGQLA